MKDITLKSLAERANVSARTITNWFLAGCPDPRTGEAIEEFDSWVEANARDGDPQTAELKREYLRERIRELRIKNQKSESGEWIPRDWVRSQLQLFQTMTDVWWENCQLFNAEDFLRAAAKPDPECWYAVRDVITRIRRDFWDTWNRNLETIRNAPPVEDAVEELKPPARKAKTAKSTKRKGKAKR